MKSRRFHRDLRFKVKQKIMKQNLYLTEYFENVNNKWIKNGIKEGKCSLNKLSKLNLQIVVKEIITISTNIRYFFVE